MKTWGWGLGVAVVVVVLVVLGGLGCGGGGLGSGGACGKVQPCGGSIIGTWTFAAGCILDSSVLLGDSADLCATATVDVTSFTGAGSTTFDADLTYQESGTETISYTLTIPTSCFTMGKTCADVSAALTQEMQTDSTLKSASCATSGSACVCKLESSADVTESGTYTTAGTTVSTTPADGSGVETDQYCVQGPALHDIEVDMSTSMGSMGVVKIAGDIVFTKQ